MSRTKVTALIFVIAACLSLITGLTLRGLADPGFGPHVIRVLTFLFDVAVVVLVGVTLVYVGVGVKATFRGTTWIPLVIAVVGCGLSAVVLMTPNFNFELYPIWFIIFASLFFISGPLMLVFGATALLGLFLRHRGKTTNGPAAG